MSAKSQFHGMDLVRRLKGTAEHIAWQDEMEAVQNLAEVIVAKQRHGPIGKITLRFDRTTPRFSNHVRDG